MILFLLTALLVALILTFITMYLTIVIIDKKFIRLYIRDIVFILISYYGLILAISYLIYLQIHFPLL